ncbi:MAG: FAD-binding oxidoreductase [Alphaproteobacteria bacterium]|nr:FAD-binding oxidoreductase [Alphaproteobacteria bacterium]
MARIVIVGGGLIGSAIAWYLAKGAAAADVVVIEPDPTYEFAATPRSVGAVRLIQGLRENLEMSLYGREVYTNFDTLIDAGGDPIDTGFNASGFMFCEQGDAAHVFERDHRMIEEVGADVRLLDRRALEAMMPSFRFDDIDAALYSPGDGRIDPHAALQGFRRGALHLGVAYRRDRVTGIDKDNAKATGVALESGNRLDAEIVVNAANCWAPDVCRMVGMEIPVEPVRRQTFFFDIQAEIEVFPGIRDHTNMSVRPEGAGYIVGQSAKGAKAGFFWDLDHTEFDETLWPLMARRCPAFEAVKYKGGWVGHYDQNRLDGNPILGPWVGGLENFIVAAGFSGHGLQHAPAVARGLAELILHGEYRSLDLSLFSYQRVLDGAPIDDTGPAP